MCIYVYTVYTHYCKYLYVNDAGGKMVCVCVYIYIYIYINHR